MYRIRVVSRNFYSKIYIAKYEGEGKRMGRGQHAPRAIIWEWNSFFFPPPFCCFFFSSALEIFHRIKRAERKWLTDFWYLENYHHGQRSFLLLTQQSIVNSFLEKKKKKYFIAQYIYSIQWNFRYPLVYGIVDIFIKFL